ncbi:hypothetical protein [Nocardia brasiliensis]|uniref:hypothetical protein n=1 Tax=Nocardia brasiliensis TaxID=37326 RepID=UPI002458DE2E|nr:hypothetical protein [Nocardia brasiliensis]
MSGDPVEESGQTIRQGFVQAMQTATSTMALIRNAGGESRSRTEFAQRTAITDQREQRSAYEHQVRVWGHIQTVGQKRDLNTARIDEVNARIKNADELTKVEVRRTGRLIGRADKDFERREHADKSEQRRKNEIHDQQISAYKNRETRASELHEIDKEYKQLLLVIRRRAAGLSDTLADTLGADAENAVSEAAFAAAAANAHDGFSDDRTDAKEAFTRRFTEDTGVHPDDLIDAAIVDDTAVGKDLAILEPERVQAAGEEIIDADVVDDPDPDADTSAPAARSVTVDDVVALTEELTLQAYLEDTLAGLAEDEEPDIADGSVFEQALDAATDPGTPGLEAEPELDFEVEMPPSRTLGPDVGVEP